MSEDFVGITLFSSNELDTFENFTANVPLFGFTDSLVFILRLDVNAANPTVKATTAISNIANVFTCFFLG